MQQRSMSRTLSRRIAAGFSLIGVLVAGLVADRLAPASVPLVDVLYAGFVYLLLVVIAPRMRSLPVGVCAITFCVAVESLQLTGIPATLSAAFPAARFVLGSTFAAEDLVAYAIGVTLTFALDHAARRARR